MRKPPAELRRFLQAYDPSIAQLFFAARAAILGLAPNADELLYDAYNAVAAAYTFSNRLKESFCHIAAYRDYVNLGFNRGATLPDPEGLLAGSGRSTARCATLAAHRCRRGKGSDRSASVHGTLRCPRQLSEQASALA
jgi:hypothetical protein